MKGTKKVYEEVRLQVVREALAGIKVAVLGRKYELHPETIRTWIREYRDQVEEAGFPDLDEQNRELKRLQEVEEKYQTAVKMLGEKELELEILRDLVKKTSPAYRRNSN